MTWHIGYKPHASRLHEAGTLKPWWGQNGFPMKNCRINCIQLLETVRYKNEPQVISLFPQFSLEQAGRSVLMYGTTAASHGIRYRPCLSCVTCWLVISAEVADPVSGFGGGQYVRAKLLLETVLNLPSH